jgi:multidrug efflux pump subunit AcrA (membrane-fusion protein)
MDWLAASVALSFAVPAFGAAFDCLIEPNQTVELASPVTGLLEEVRFKRGDRVGKGEVVALLESRAEQAAAQLARFKSEQLGPTQMAERKIEFSRRKFSRRRDMTAEGLMPLQERDDAAAELKQAESELQLAKENREAARLEFEQQSRLLALRTIRSPFDGVVVEPIRARWSSLAVPGGRS